MTDEETVAEHVYSEVALRKGKRSSVQLIQNNNILQNIYIIYYTFYIYIIDKNYAYKIFRNYYPPH